MEFRVTHTDKATGQQKTEVITGTTKETLVKQYSAMGFEVNNVEELAPKNNTPVDALPDPMNIQIPNMGAPMQNTPVESRPESPKWKEFEAAGIKFRINSNSGELQEFNWIDSEDDSILDEIGVGLEEGQKMTFREILEHANINELGFIKKAWIKKED